MGQNRGPIGEAVFLELHPGRLAGRHSLCLGRSQQSSLTTGFGEVQKRQPPGILHLIVRGLVNFAPCGMLQGGPRKEPANFGKNRYKIMYKK